MTMMMMCSSAGDACLVQDLDMFRPACCGWRDWLLKFGCCTRAVFYRCSLLVYLLCWQAHSVCDCGIVGSSIHKVASASDDCMYIEPEPTYAFTSWFSILCKYTMTVTRSVIS